MSKKYVYVWGNGMAEGNLKMRDILGGKGVNLAEMTMIGVPVPPGFTISTEVCKYYWDNNNQFPEVLKEQVEVALKKTEEMTGKKFVDENYNLLV